MKITGRLTYKKEGWLITLGRKIYDVTMCSEDFPKIYKTVKRDGMTWSTSEEIRDKKTVKTIMKVLKKFRTVSTNSFEGEIR